MTDAIRVPGMRRCPFTCEWCMKEVDEAELVPRWFDLGTYDLYVKCHGWSEKRILDMKSVSPTDFVVFRRPRQIYFGFYA